MKPSPSSLRDPAFVLLLAFLLLVPVSIAACYVLGTLLLALFLRHLLRGGKFPSLPFFSVFFAVFIVFTLLSTFFSVDRAASIRDNKELLIFLLFPIFFWVLRGRERIQLSLWTVLASAVFSALVGILATLRKGISLSDRLTGFTSHWMTYAGLLMLPFVFFSVRLLLLRRGRKQDGLLLASLALLLAAIAFSLTRSVWLGIAAALGLFLVFFKPRLLLLAPLALAAVLLVPPAVKGRLLSIVDMQDKSNRDRIHMAYSGWKLFQDRPWTGVGSHNVEKVIASDEARYRHPRAEKINPHLHNNFLQILAERGVLALAAFVLACLFAILQMGRELKRCSSERRALVAGSLFAFVGFLVAGLFEYNFGDSEIKFLLFYFLSLPFIQWEGEEHVQPETDR
ncbi:MAG: O-antigen ligase family protein [Candidatus Aminicenantes bacterium]|nr:O-antigen ligase family protein [Candidatus Aminicenantes bacterium]